MDGADHIRPCKVKTLVVAFHITCWGNRQPLPEILLGKVELQYLGTHRPIQPQRAFLPQGVNRENAVLVHFKPILECLRKNKKKGIFA